MKCEELPNGDVALSSRTWGGRYFNIFHYRNARLAQGEWGQVAYSSAANQGVDAQKNSTNGGILIVLARRTSDNRKTWVALQSVPLGPGRSNVGIYYKELLSAQAYSSPAVLAANWSGPYKVSSVGSAYSELERLGDGKIGIFYEETSHKADYTLVFNSFSLSEITNGRFR